MSLTLLINALREDLAPDANALLDDPAVYASCVEYIDTLVSTNPDLLLSLLPPSITDDHHPRTLVEEVAELSLKQRETEDALRELAQQEARAAIALEQRLAAAEALFHEDLVPRVALLAVELDHWQHRPQYAAPAPPLAAVVQARSILDNLGTLNDLLELPLQIQRCVRQGKHQEALEIHSFAKRLVIRFSLTAAADSSGHRVNVLNHVLEQVQAELHEMMLGLVQTLSLDAKQLVLIKTVHTLARLAPFSGAARALDQLKVLYLDARAGFVAREFSYLEPLLRTGLVGNLERYLKRAIEIVREHGYALIVTYRAAFPDRDENSDAVFLHHFFQPVFLLLVQAVAAQLPRLLDTAAGDADADVKTLKDGILLQLYYCFLLVARVGGQLFQLMLVDVLDTAGVVTEAEWRAVEHKVARATAASG